MKCSVGIDFGIGTSPPENPNAEDDSSAVYAARRLRDAVIDLWDAGATINDLASTFEGAIHDATPEPGDD